MNEEEAKKIMEMLIDYNYNKILEIMASPPYLDFDEALVIRLEEIKK